MQKFRKFIVPLAVGLILLTLISACGGSQPASEDGTAPALGGTDWQLLSINGVEALVDTPVILSLGSNNNLYAFTGCNLLTGDYQLSGSQININTQQTSGFECSDALTVQEEAFILVLDSASEYQISGDQLTLTNPDDTRTAILSAATLPPLEGTSWQLNSFNDGQGAFVAVLQGSEITAEFGTEGQLSGTAGCNNYTTSYQVDGDKISIEPAVTTLMACAEPEGIMEQETNYLGSLTASATYKNLVLALLLADERGLPVAFYVTTGE